VSLAGNNIVATAETGSGKTMCFATVALAAVSRNKKAPQVLIMAHNRPLLDQLCDEMDKLCSSLNNEITCAFADRQDRGGGTYVPSTQIVIATAGTLNMMLRKQQLPTRDIKLVIADEVEKAPSNLTLGSEIALIKLVPA
jgi:superfamily II DNA/RNA helicase